jgi:hypothetical protein
MIFCDALCGCFTRLVGETCFCYFVYSLVDSTRDSLLQCESRAPIHALARESVFAIFFRAQGETSKEHIVTLAKAYLFSLHFFMYLQPMASRGLTIMCFASV